MSGTSPLKIKVNPLIHIVKLMIAYLKVDFVFNSYKVTENKF